MRNIWYCSLRYLKCKSSEVLNKIQNVKALLTGWRSIGNTEFAFNFLQSLFNHFLGTWQLTKSCSKHSLSKSVLQWFQNNTQAIPRCNSDGKNNSHRDPSSVTQLSKTFRVKAMDVSFSVGQVWRSTLQNLWEAHSAIFSSLLF